MGAGTGLFYSTEYFECGGGRCPPTGACTTGANRTRRFLYTGCASCYDGAKGRGRCQCNWERICNTCANCTAACPRRADWRRRTGRFGIGWDFPFVSKEQQNRLGLRGYAAGWILPEGFEPRSPGMELFSQPAARYAKLTVSDPFREAFDRIPKGYQRILSYLGANGFKESHGSEFLPCFEEVYEREGMTYMDIYIHAESVGRANLHTDFSRER